MKREPAVILLAGTLDDPPAGGVGAALCGFEAAAAAAGIACQRISTHRSGGIAGKLLPWAVARRQIPSLVREVVARGDLPVVHAHAGAWPSLVRKADLLAVSRAAGARTLLQLHGVEIDRYMDRRIGRALLRRALGSADRVAVLSPWWRSRLARAMPGTEPVVLPNPLSDELLAEARRAEGAVPMDPDRLSVLILARLVPGKGVGTVIDAVARLGPDAGLVVAGDGPRRRALQRRARRAGIGARTRWTGWVGGEARRTLLRCADVVCQPGRHDAFPLSLLEAMAFGVPVVASRERAIPDLVPDGRAGLLVDGADPEAVRGALERLRDPALRRSQGAAGRAHVLASFAPAVVGERLARVVCELRGAPQAAVDTP